MSETPLHEIRIDQATHASIEVIDSNANNSPKGLKKSENPLERDDVSYPSWLKQLIMQEVKEPEIKKSNGRPKIPKVSCGPPRYRECYNPVVVSIGPYHHSARNEKLGDVEKLKAPITHQFVKDCAAWTGDDNEDILKKLYVEVQGVAKEARSFYDESELGQFNDEEFLKMMLIDGCFILKFIDCWFNAEKLEMTDQQVASVKQDLLLVENEIPFPVLKSLMRVRYKSEQDGIYRIYDFLFHNLHSGLFGGGIYIYDRGDYLIWILFPILVPIMLIAYMIMLIAYMIMVIIEFFDLPDKISRYCRILGICPRDSDYPREKVEEHPRKDNQPAHLLELLYSEFMSSENGKRRYHKLILENGSGHYLRYSAKNLKKVGIHFQPMWFGELTDVNFKSSIFFGTLKLPSLRVNESTKSLLLNLAAYEESTSSDQYLVASYISFMDSLINDAEDVEELRSKGIVVNDPEADQQVADFFNDMGKYLKPDASTYNDVKMKINKQCESRISKWVAEWQQTYFRSPWTIIAVLAAALGLALTAVQTYYTAYAQCK